jgi:apolipoprotein N-acyltransferase
MVSVRAVENRVPVVRVANTGFSAMVDPDGSIRWRSDLFTTEWRVDTVRWVGESTFYTRYGDVFAWGCLLLLLAVVLVGTFWPRELSMDGRQPA